MSTVLKHPEVWKGGRKHALFDMLQTGIRKLKASEREDEALAVARTNSGSREMRLSKS